MSLKHLLTIEQDKKKSRALLKRRKFNKPINYRSFINSKGNICTTLKNKHEIVDPVEVLDSYYDVDVSNLEKNQGADDVLLGKR